VYWARTGAGAWCPFDPDTRESHFLRCPDAKEWSRSGRRKEIKTEDEPKFLARVGTDLLLLRAPGGGHIETARDPKTGDVTVAAISADGFGVPMSRDLYRKHLQAQARWFLGIELEALAREAPEEC
jgi:hypothetical protein